MRATSGDGRRDFPSAASSLSAVRTWSMDRTREAGAPGEVVDAVQLAMSETFTNALRHAPGSPSVSVRARGEDRALTFEVRDGAATPPRRREGRGGLPGGHGLHILDAVTAAWGWRPAPDGGKVVWFTVRW